jgi:hypothetical protein
MRRVVRNIWGGGIYRCTRHLHKWQEGSRCGPVTFWRKALRNREIVLTQCCSGFDIARRQLAGTFMPVPFNGAIQEQTAPLGIAVRRSCADCNCVSAQSRGHQP